MTTRQDISRWFDAGVKQKSMFMFVICDTFSYEDYPWYKNSVQDALDLQREFPKNMQKIMEIYDLRKDKEKQLKEKRNFAEIK